jgi:hypothetical protein
MSTHSGARNRSKLRRVGNEAIVDVGAQHAPELFFTNVEQFDALKDASVLLFYTETTDDVVFDPSGDRALLRLHVDPWAFKNTDSLATYEALTTRARYYCKPHPNQELAQSEAGLELSIDASDLLILVYQRDSAGSSAVKQRRRTPFRNGVNGIGAHARSESTVVTLFSKLSHDPFTEVTVVWQREQRPNATIGMIGVRILRLFE